MWKTRPSGSLWCETKHSLHHRVFTNLCGRSARKNQDLLAEKRHAVCEGNRLDIAQQLRDEINPEILEKHSETRRVRDYPQPLVFWSFLGQVASEDSSCARAVSRVQA